MELRSRRISFVVFILLSCFCTYLGTAIDTITASRPIRDPETIISNGSAFILGFFSPGNSSNRYVGIWYNKKSEPVIWVANRNKPLKNASGVVSISEDGNLVVLNEQNEVLWSSSVSNPVNNVSAQLLDTGNLVLRDITTGIIWESFREPTDTFLAGMKLRSQIRTGPIVQLRSWKSPSDPSPGSFSLGIDPSNIPETIIWNDSRVYARSGPWNGQFFLGIPNMYSIYIDGYKLSVDDQTGVVDFYYLFPNKSMFFVISSQGISERKNWVDEENNWEVIYRSQETECDVYGWCGAFGSCNPEKKPICSCLRGFEPKTIQEWNRGNWTSGCVRKSPLQCERKINQTGEVKKEDGFLKLEMMKLPYFEERSSVSAANCREYCLNNCSCIAYAYDTGIGCMTWTGSLIDLQKFSSGGADLYIRLAHSELEKKGNKVVVIVPVVAGTITGAICIFFLCRFGNLVLRDITTGIRIWESFQEPTDTFLVGMDLSSHMRTGPIVQLRYWKSPSDPSPGSFSFGIGSSNIPEGFIWNDSQVYWRTGPWNGQLFIGILFMYSGYLDGYKLLADGRTGFVNFSYSFPNTSIFYVLTTLGIIEERYRDDEKNDWVVTFLSRETECDVYGWCGAFGNCNPQKKPICSCLRGFEPMNMEEWSRGNWTNGCFRKKQLQCERINQTGEVAKQDGFLKLEMKKVPYFAERSPIPVENCSEHCLNNCSCIVYAYDAGIGCMTWTRSLIDLQKFSNGDADLYIRLAHTELGKFHDVLSILLLLC
ncbi:hypothetical protein LWI28_012026 [Acer negundo]|uniref:Receptor-like serine/threonine-protein kinase n=1 Tax=Acer negundo TaxID=4023 RepID=A0AAD5JGC8_ACENE|nr:hypothetical protein LWI28_012026 [Acer negundo]